MILRKPTRIELKPEEDLQEYEDFKKKLAETNKISRSNQSLKDNKFGSFLRFNKEPEPNRMNLPQEFYRTPNSDSAQRSQGWNQREETGGVNQLFSSLLSRLNPEGMEPTQTTPQRGHHPH